MEYSLTLIERRKKELTLVLILVLMEYSLTKDWTIRIFKIKVLILVLMECSLTLMNVGLVQKLGCLNPCSNGMLSDVRFEGNQMFVEES